MFALTIVCAAAACTPKEAAVPTATQQPIREKPVLTGALTRAQLDAIPGWSSTDRALDALVDHDAARALASAPKAHVQVILGTWCGDSKREVPRLLHALDIAERGGGATFTLDMIGVDRDKKSPGLTIDVAYVPTFIVTRDGKELGRIVESAPNGVEKDLASLLSGEKSGVLSGRSDLAR